MARYFSVEEANRTVEQVRPLVKKILEIRQIVLNKRPDLIPVLQKIVGNGGNREASELVKEFQQLEALVREIQATGALVKDVNIGLLDFPHLREGREVYLCWQYGEEKISFWHEVEAGFSGRQPL
ncbi:MAG: DUF2203 domain-containing protein [Chloroflexota bacterium]